MTGQKPRWELVEVTDKNEQWVVKLGDKVIADVTIAGSHQHVVVREPPEGYCWEWMSSYCFEYPEHELCQAKDLIRDALLILESGSDVWLLMSGEYCKRRTYT